MIPDKITESRAITWEELGLIRKYSCRSFILKIPCDDCALNDSCENVWVMNKFVNMMLHAQPQFQDHKEFHQEFFQVNFGCKKIQNKEK